MKRVFSLLLAAALLAPAAARADDPAEFLYNFCKSDGVADGLIPASEEWGIHPHKRNYVLMGQWGTPNAADGMMNYIKYQLSIKQHLCKSLNFGYTQKSLWSVTAPSLPFRETNYNPEFYLDYTDNGSGIWRWGKIGLFEHESNGRDGPDSRSWNRIYWEPRLVIDDPEKLPLGFTTLVAALKWWYAYSAVENADIRDYQGNNELSITLNQYWMQWAVIVRKGRIWDYGSVQVDINYHFMGNMDIFFQFWDGYGESLVDYNRSSTRYGFGIAINR
ncbi:MAG: phospholipase A [Nitrospinae bacterium]|nr:phospholipase A [Nitrospinota bacterium]